MFFATAEGFIPFLSKTSVRLLYEVLMLGREVGFYSLQVTTQSYKIMSFPLPFGYITVHNRQIQQQIKKENTRILTS